MEKINLSTSDWVAIGMGVTQLVVSVAIGVWTIRSTPAVTQSSYAASTRKGRSFIWEWFKSSWIFLLSFSYALYQVWSLAVGSEGISKALVLEIILYSAYGTLNAIASVGFFLVQIQLEFMERVTKLLAKMSQAHGNTAEIQKGHLAITKQLLENKKPKSRR